MKDGRFKKQIFEIWGSGYSSYNILLAIFIMVFIIPMTAERWLFTSIIAQLLASVLLVVGVFSVPCSLFIRSIALISIGLAIISRLIHEFMYLDFLGIVENILAILLLSVFAFLMARQFLSINNLISHRIAGAVAIYLLIGILFARIYQLLVVVDPLAFEIRHYEGFPTLVYFSFVTLVTIGYGDIIPLSLVARNLAVLEGVMGQLYVVILISSLVSKNVASSFTKK